MERNQEIYIVGMEEKIEIPTTICLKIANLRKVYKDEDINLEKWMQDDNNLYIGRRGRIFIKQKDGSSKIFHYPGSKWGNPYVVDDGKKKEGKRNNKIKYDMETSLKLYTERIVNSDLYDQLRELSGKKLGCFCDRECHAKVLVELFKKKFGC